MLMRMVSRKVRLFHMRGHLPWRQQSPLIERTCIWSMCHQMRLTCLLKLWTVPILDGRLILANYLKAISNMELDQRIALQAKLWLLLKLQALNRLKLMLNRNHLVRPQPSLKFFRKLKAGARIMPQLMKFLRIRFQITMTLEMLMVLTSLTL